MKCLDLINAIEEMENGLFEAALGGGIYKKRIAIDGRGKSGGARVIIALRLNDRAFFLHGFKKNDANNISKNEEMELKELATVLFSLDEKQLSEAIMIGELVEVG